MTNQGFLRVLPSGKPACFKIEWISTTGIKRCWYRPPFLVEGETGYIDGTVAEGRRAAQRSMKGLRGSIRLYRIVEEEVRGAL